MVEFPTLCLVGFLCVQMCLCQYVSCAFSLTVFDFYISIDTFLFYLYFLSFSFLPSFFFFLRTVCLIMRARKSVDQVGTKRVEGGEAITRIYSVKKDYFH